VGERLVLWDVDGTLIRAGLIAREAFDRAVERVLGRHPGEHGVQMSGKTDPQIALEILTFAAVADDDAEAHLPAILGHLEAELAGAAEELRRHGRVLPGVPETLEALHHHPAAHSTCLTGNIEANARAKLAACGLTVWLDLEIGAYGSDHAERELLVPVALDRARRLRGVEVEPDAVWVVGDTPRDLACARAAGARCLLVATGRFSRDELAGAGADVVLDDLSDVDAVLDVLVG
jgi:phosphoglycolate phosphatase